MARYSDSQLDQETVGCFLALQDTRNCNSSIIAAIHLGSLEAILKPRDLVVIGCVVLEEDGCCKFEGVEVSSFGGSGCWAELVGGDTWTCDGVWGGDVSWSEDV
ncbi:hypothetical protein Tco_0737674 [Tanacetum coccineum]